MLSLKKVAGRPRALRSTKFIPGRSLGEDGARLEGRSLAAPGFFRFGNALEIAYASTGGTNQPFVAQVDPVVALQFGYSQTNAMGMTNSIFTSSSQAEAIDGGVSTPTNLVSTAAVAGNTSSAISAMTPGPIPGIANVMGTREVWNRQYALADTVNPVGPETLVETFLVQYAPSYSTVYPSGMQVTLFSTSMTSASNGAGIVIAGGVNGITNVVVAGDLMNAILPGGSGTYTNANNTITPLAVAGENNNSTFVVTTSSTTVLVTATTVFPNGLPNVQPTPQTPPGGIPWFVAVDARLNMGGQSQAGAMAMTSLTTHYEAEF